MGFGGLDPKTVSALLNASKTASTPRGSMASMGQSVQHGAVFEIKGLDEMLRNLQQLGDAVFEKVMASALRSAALPIEKAAKANLDSENAKRWFSLFMGSNKWVRTGALKASIQSLVRKYHTNRTVIAVVGPETKKHWVYTGKGETGFHMPEKVAWNVEHGHGGPKPAPAHPFLEPALQSTKGKVATILMKRLAAGFDREAFKCRAR